jgi:hypothetical protein
MKLRFMQEVQRLKAENAELKRQLAAAQDQKPARETKKVKPSKKDD